jgi:hypothetical protein
MPFKEGQEVLIKNPRSLVGVIVRERPGDRDELPENRHYLVRIPDTEKFYLPLDLEVLEEPTAKLKQYSSEWNAELARWIDAGQRLMANNNDLAALQEFSESGSKIGFIVPILDSSKT